MQGVIIFTQIDVAMSQIVKMAQMKQSHRTRLPLPC